MTMTTCPGAGRAGRFWLRWLLWCLLVLCGSAAQAQNCWNSGKSDLNFGPIAVGSAATTMGDVQVTCRASDWPLAPTVFRMCIYAAGYPTTADISPRRMTNNGVDGQPPKFMPYYLYSDAARTSILGPEGNSSYTAYVRTFTVPPSTTQTFTIPIYGRATATAGLPGGQGFYAYNNTVTVDWAGGLLGITPANCNGGLLVAGGTATFGLQVQASTINSCTVSIASASDMDFGSATSLAAARDSTSAITLNCPSNSQWKVGLSNGLHAQGTQRRMAGPGSDFISYELYRDPGRTQRWGSNTASGGDTVNGGGSGSGSPVTLTVYGRVPAQPAVQPGSYGDTITVTLTY
ncbi:spore coat protein U domain-containing protein [Xenophilus sp.]|uniref:spore coat protein U domain-containing protein n=1 Tax=Xenophilus sp. TaxID=1873499 RepID=UPI0037DC68CF